MREQIAPVRDDLARLREEALFNGEYDQGDAVVTITAGTGGTDAQDWAEMLLRMYLRWTADRGFQTELVEASPGEEAGLKSATLTVRGRERLRAVQGRARRPSAGAPVALRLRAPTAYGVRAGRRRAAAARDRRRRDRRERAADRHVPRERGGRAAREQDRLRGADHAPPDRDRRPVPERAVADVEQADRDADPPLAPRGARARRSGRQSSRRSGAGRSTSGSAARSAPTSSTRTRWSRTTGRATRRGTRRQCSTARSTTSSRSTSSRAPPARRSHG